MIQIVHNEMPVLPVAVYEDENRFCMRFGPCFSIQVSESMTSKEQDFHAIQQVMRQIARLMPERLRGEYHIGDLQ